MNMKPFVFEASWDDKAKVGWISKTPIPGLVTEASTIGRTIQQTFHPDSRDA